MGLYSSVIFPRLCDLVLDRPMIARLRRHTLRSACGNILEIGIGSGLNLGCYPAGVRSIAAVDPSPAMHRLARNRSKEAGVQVEHHTLGGEDMPFETGCFDCVVSTFTMCSIPDLARALAEMRRVLKPGGQLLFLEHGLSPQKHIQWWQRQIKGLEMLLGDGCRVDLPMRSCIAAAHFARVDCDEFYLPWAPRTHGYLYRGRAIRGEDV